MVGRLVAIGNFSFRYRGYMLPIAVLLLVIPSPAFTADPALAGLAGFVIATLGQAVRILTIGLAYIIRGGKNHQVYAEHLVTIGLYSHCRNPMYVGNFFLLAGLAVASNSWVFAVAGVLLSLGLHKTIVAAEEYFLHRKFGPQYENYCKRVPRWVPRLAGLKKTVGGMQFDWLRVLRKEYAATFDWYSAVAVVVLVNLYRADVLERHAGLRTLLILVVILRIVLWVVARHLNKHPDTIPS